MLLLLPVREKGSEPMSLVAEGRVGVLLLNMGTPDAPEEEAIRRYLAEMLSDPALISCPPVIWRRVLDHVILPKRPKKTVGRYRSFWTDAGSPYLLDTLEQARLLERKLKAQGFDVVCRAGMRYGNPPIMSRLCEMRDSGVMRLVVLPLFPQETRATTQSALDEVSRCLSSLSADGWDPSVSLIRSYCDNPAYIRALTKNVAEAWHPGSNSRLAVSFHSTVVKDIEAGDPYRDQAESTAQGVARGLRLKDGSWKVTYQSRFDNRKWLKPLLVPTLEEWAKEGVDDVCVICPGFAADCLETSIEVAGDARDRFLSCAKPGARFTYVPALGTSAEHIDLLASEVISRLA